jgi:hypothetical protein
MSSSTPNSTKASHPERSAPTDGDEITRLTERAGVVIGIATGILGGLLATGFAFLPVNSLAEKGWVFFACLAVSVASVTGIGAWRNARRFGLTATCMCVTVICLAGLSVAAQDDHPTTIPQRTAASAASTSPQTSTTVPSEPSASLPSSALTSPTASQVPKPVVANVPAPRPLVDMTPVDPSLSNYSAGQQKVDGQVYPETIYDETRDDYTCNDSIPTDSTGQVIYELDRKYAKFHAVVGLADTSASGDTITFKVLVDGQKRYASTPLAAGETQAINMSISGAFRITLEDVCSSQTQYSGGPSVTAVWINPEVSS